MNTVILFRELSSEYKEEKDSASEFFPVFSERCSIPKGSTIVGRYSVLPFYRELERDLSVLDCKLINSYQQHRYVADIKNYYEDLKDITPTTWWSFEEIPPQENGPFVLKGETNSKKFLWNSHMFAQNKADAIKVMINLRNDSMIGEQDIIIRKFVPLKTYFTGCGGYPVTREFRFFVLDGNVVGSGFYWASFYDDIVEAGFESETDPDSVPKDFLLDCINRIKDRVRFFVIDVAEKTDGGWMVVELNDGQMSGLSMIDHKELYKNLYNTLTYSS